jgi:hypothetical protein
MNSSGPVKLHIVKNPDVNRCVKNQRFIEVCSTATGGTFRDTGGVLQTTMENIMARIAPKLNGTTETARDVTGAENSKNSYNVLKMSMALAVLAAVVLAVYFGVFSPHHAATSATG